jgi:tRNA pseudouridine38-40 synthase
LPETLNIKLTIQYDGSNYFGWQKQRNRPSVQQTIENAIQTLFPYQPIHLIGSGRTDTGVHALNQVANFKLQNSPPTKGGRGVESPLTKGGRGGVLPKLFYSLNSILPRDIAVKKAQLVPHDFHSRYSARRRIYKYFLSTEKQTTFRNWVYHVKTKFDIDLAKEYCKLLPGVHSFRYLCKTKSDKHDFQSEVYYARLRKRNTGIFEFEISAIRFLHSMVRAIVGIMIQVASSKTSIQEFKYKFYNKEPLRIQYVPAHALFLDRVIY